jgi:hypothetical protein
MAKSDEDIEAQTREMNSNIKHFQESISSLTANAKSARELAEEYMKFKLKLQSTLENVISLNTANTNTQSEIEQKLKAYKKLLVEYKSKIPLLQKEDFNNLSSEIEKIKSLLEENESTKTNRVKLLREAESMVDELRKQNTTRERETTKQQNVSAEEQSENARRRKARGPPPKQPNPAKPQSARLADLRRESEERTAKLRAERSRRAQGPPPKQQNPAKPQSARLADLRRESEERTAKLRAERSRRAQDTAAARLSGDKLPSGFRDNPVLPKPNKATEGRPAGGRKKSKKTRKSRKTRKTRRR